MGSEEVLHKVRIVDSSFRELAYPGAEVLRDVQSVVNQIPVSTALFNTRAPVGAVQAYYLTKLSREGWIREVEIEQVEESKALTNAGAKYLVATRGGKTLRVHLLPAGKPEGTLIYLQLKAKQSGQKGSVPADLVTKKINPLPLFPGVTSAFYLEEGQIPGQKLVMYSVRVALSAITDFYDQKLKQSGWRLEFSYPVNEGDKKEGRVMVYDNGRTQCLLSVQKMSSNPATVLLIIKNRG